MWPRNTHVTESRIAIAAAGVVAVVEESKFIVVALDGMRSMAG